MGYDFGQLPANNDFTAWKQPLLDQIDKYCSGELKFVRSSLQWGGDVLNSLSDDESTLRLYNYLDKENPDGLKPWTNRQWWMIFIFSLGIVALLWAIYLACVAGCKKAKIGRVFAPFFSKRHAPDGKPEVNPSGLGAFKVISYLTVLMCLLFGSLTYVSNAQMIIGMKQSDCNVWLHVYGHYFGGQNMTTGDNVGGVAKNWQGTRPILDQLALLQAQVTPAEDNALYVGVNEAKERLTALMQENRHTTLTAFDRLTDTHNSEVANTLAPISTRVWANLGIKSGDRLLYSLRNLGVTIVGVRLYAMQEAVKARTTIGVNALNHMVESYVGPKSVLMTKAYTSTLDAARIIEEVDVAVARVADLWVRLSSKLRGAAVTSAALSIVATSLMIIASIWGLRLASKLTKQVKSITGKVVRHRRTWLTLYSTLLVCGGVYFVLLGLDLVVGGLGAGMCSIADQRLFSEGRWALLGDEIMKPMGDSTSIDMRAVFDTCVKSTGHGEVSSVLGLDLRIQELQDDVDAALATINAAKNSLYNPKVFDADWEEIYYIFNFTTTYFYQFAGSKIFSGFRETVSPQPISVDRENGPQTMFPGMGANGMLNVMSYGFWNKMVEVGETVDFMNSFVDAANAYLDAAEEAPPPEAYSHSGLPSFVEQSPRRRLQETITGRFVHYCSDFALSQGSTCDQYPDAYDLHITDETVNTTFVDPLALSQKLKDTEFYFFDAIPSDYGLKFHHTMINLIFANTLGWLRDFEGLKFPEGVQCQDGTLTCPPWELLASLKPRISEKIGTAKAAQVNTNEEMQSFVDFVTPRMLGLASVTDGLTDATNCQYEGTALQEGVVGSLCQVLFPGTAIAAVFSVFGCVVSFVMAYVVRYYMHVAEAESYEDVDFKVEAGQPTGGDAVPEPQQATTTPPAESSSPPVIVKETPLAMEVSKEAAVVPPPADPETSDGTVSIPAVVVESPEAEAVIEISEEQKA